MSIPPDWTPNRVLTTFDFLLDVPNSRKCDKCSRRFFCWTCKGIAPESIVVRSLKRGNKFEFKANFGKIKCRPTVPKELKDECEASMFTHKVKRFGSLEIKGHTSPYWVTYQEGTFIRNGSGLSEVDDASNAKK